MLRVLRSGQFVDVAAGELIFQDDLVATDVGWVRADAHPVFAHHWAPPPEPPAPAFPWKTVVGAVLGVGAVVWAWRRLTRDPEPARIKQLAEELVDEGAEVFADIKGWPRPPVLNGRIPDVFAVHPDGSQTAIEVENDRSIERSHARAQVGDLARWAGRSRRRVFELDVVRGGRGGKS